jgi:hypothetical protein
MLPNELWKWIFTFCTTLELRHARYVCTAWERLIPFEWTIERVFLSEKETSDPANFLTDQARFRFVETVLGMYFQQQKSLDFVPQLTRVRDVHLLYLAQIERVSFPAEMNAIQDIMITCAFQVHTLILPCTWTRLRSLFLSGLNLSSFELDPAWTRLRDISLLNIGTVAQLIVPDTYTRLEFLHVERLQLTRLRLEMNPRSLLVRIQELHQVIVESREAPNETASFLMYTRAPIVWEPIVTEA